MNSNEPVLGIHLGDRKEDFKNLIKSVLKNAKVCKKYRKILLSDENMEIFSAVFTHEEIDRKNNYQVYEFLGDLSGNKFIGDYCSRKFPQLMCAEGVKVLARLKINYGSKNTFYKIAENLGFWDFISATNELRIRKKKSLLEDVFEAFLGATERILDMQVIPDSYRPGIGYATVYKILESIFDGMNISLRYEDLYDAKTRLKETFDMFGEQLGPLVYEERKDEDGNTHSIVYRYAGGKYAERPDGTVNTKKIVGRYQKVKLGEGTSTLKADAQQIAAGQAIEILKKQGYEKFSPKIYAKFSGEYKEVERDTERKDVFAVIGTEENINEQFPTRGKSKYQNKYTSTVLSKYCDELDLEGIKIALEMGADPTIVDSDGLYPMDRLLLANADRKLVKKVKKLFGKRFVVSKDVYDSKFGE